MMALRLVVAIFVYSCSICSTICSDVNELTTSREWSTQPTHETSETLRTMQLINGSDVTSSRDVRQHPSVQVKDSTSWQEHPPDSATPQHAASGERNIANSDNTSANERQPYAENTIVPATNETTDAVTINTGMWRSALVYLQLVVYVVGFVANAMTFITLMRNGDIFSPSTCLLLKHQALVDSWVCATGAIILLEPPMWTTGNKYFDAAVCFIWHTQTPFWGAILLSVWNLAAIALERYMAICFPFKHGQFREEMSRNSIAVIYVVNVIVAIPCFFQVRFEHGACIWGYFIRGRTGEQVYYVYGFVWFLFVYVLPVMAYVFLYGRVIITLYRKKNLKRSAVVEAAQAAITKTAVTLTTICLFAIGFDAWYYVLGNAGVVELKAGSDIDRVAVVLSVVNSCVNPFIYLFLITPFRFMVLKTFSCYTKSDTTTSSDTTNTRV